MDKNLEHFQTEILSILSKFGNKTKKSIISSLDNLTENDIETLNSAIESLKSEGKIKYSRSKPQGYYIVEDIEVTEKIPTEVQESEKHIEIVPDSRQDNRSKFINTVKEKGLIPIKSELKDLVINSGITENEFTTLFNELKSENILIYSRSSPRGYSISKDTSFPEPKTTEIKISEEKQAVKIDSTEEKREFTKESEDFNASKIKFIELLSNNSPISSKQKLLNFMEKNGLTIEISDKIMVFLKNNGTLVYSRKSPQGYSIKK